MGLNKTSFAFMLVFVCLTLCHDVFSDTMPETQRIIDYDELTNGYIKDNMVLLLGDKYLHKLNENLTIEKTLTICTTNPCENRNKILLVNSNKAILCGTQNEGQCQIRSLDNIENVQQNLSLSIPTEPEATTQALLVPDNHILIGYNITDGNDVIYKIEKLDLSSSGPALEEYVVASELINASTPSVYYKAAEQYKIKNYFFINIKHGSQYKSQIVTVCNNNNNNELIDISCQKGDTAYNLIQDAVILELEGVAHFVGAFVSGTDPQNLHGESAICVGLLSEVDPSEGSSCSNTNTSKVLTRVHTLSTDLGYITKVSGHDVSADILVIQAGTSKGRLIQASMTSTELILYQFDKTIIQTGSPVRNIYTSNAHTYVMTEKKVAKYMPPSCEQYTTCKETVDGKNPYCGWCIVDGRYFDMEVFCPEPDCAYDRSTTNTDCSSGNWINVFDQCVGVSVSPSAQKIGDPGQMVILTVKDFPTSGNDTFVCRITALTKEPVAERKSDTRFECTIPVVGDQELDNSPGKGQTTLELVGIRNNKKYIVGSASYLFYKCTDFNKCGECTDSSMVQCNWCSAKCQDDTCSPSISANQCPKVTITETQYVPHGSPKQVTFDVSNLGQAGYHYSCIVSSAASKTETFAGTFLSNQVSCDVNLQIAESDLSKQEFGLKLMYGPQNADVEVDSDSNSNNTVTVYRCEQLAKDCTQCRALNRSRYNCNWESDVCAYKAAGFDNSINCPAPAITKISPNDGNNNGGTQVTITGTDMPTSTSVVVRLGATSCENAIVNPVRGPDFQEPVFDSIHCKTKAASNWPKDLETRNEAVHVTIGGNNIASNVNFTYKKPNIFRIEPTKGIALGGKITFTGENLQSGNKRITVKYNGATDFMSCNVSSDSIVMCNLPETVNTDMKFIRGVFDDSSRYNFPNLIYTVLDNPKVHNISAYGMITSGGLRITISGSNFTNTYTHTLVVSYNGMITQQACDNVTDTTMVCRFPKAPSNVNTDLQAKTKSQAQHRRKRSASCQCIEVTLRIQMDGYHEDYTISYYPDPDLYNMTKIENVGEENEYITLYGQFLNLAATKEDFSINIGDRECVEIELGPGTIRCKVPDNKQDGSKHSVTVTVGNIHATLGFVQYGEVDTVLQILIPVVAVIGGVIGLFLVGLAVGCGRIQMLKMQKRKLEKELEDREREVRYIARQEFVEMNHGMSSVSKNLVEQGLPFHGYQQYAFNVLFSADQALIDQVIYAQEAGQLKNSTKKALDALEKLILNKFFLISIVSTMEKQKRFFQKERANLSGNMCAILMGKMGYLNEVLQDLLMELVKDAVARKQQKSLFRRSETITECLLNNWLALTLYPHFRLSSGSPLYLLYMAMQLTMESGPIDALTADAKYTLCEEKLLRKWESTIQGGRDGPDAQQLTLKVIIDNGDQVYDCKVMDCDTITQVKAKCLSQIYVNYPASQLGVDPSELLLNWHAGHTTSMTLKDEDHTSIREGNLIRLNTLAHYNVKNNANVALVDPKSLDQEDYSNINLEFPDQGDKTRLLNNSGADDVDDDMYRWHLVKPREVEDEPTEKSAIDELYLNKLFTTKQSIMEHMKALFDHILDSDVCPPPAKFICDYMDILANEVKVDENTLNSWKSQSYAACLWGRMIRNPQQLFDVMVPPYLEDSLDVIARTFEDSLRISSRKFTKDMPAQKLIFHFEIEEYKKKVKDFHKGLQQAGEQSNELTNYLGELNKTEQQQQSFNKMAYLQKFYKQLEPYLEEIMEGLRYTKECNDLGLDRKMEEVVDMMQ